MLFKIYFMLIERKNFFKYVKFKMRFINDQNVVQIILSYSYRILREQCLEMKL